MSTEPANNDLAEAILRWTLMNGDSAQGQIGVVVLGCGARGPQGLAELGRKLQSEGMAHHIIDLAMEPRDEALNSILVRHFARAQDFPPEEDGPAAAGPRGVTSIAGLRQWMGWGDEAAKAAGAALEKCLSNMLNSGRRILFWLTPHAWDTLRHGFPILAEQWSLVGRLDHPEAGKVAAELMRNWRMAAVPVRHRGLPERAERRLERFSKEFNQAKLEGLSPEHLAWGVIVPWLRTLLDAGACARLLEEFRRWAPSIESVAAAYGLSLLCVAEAEMTLDCYASAEGRLDEALARLEAAGHKKGMAIARSMKAQIAAASERFSEAEILLALSTEEAEQIDAMRLVGWNCVILAAISVIRGREHEAHPYLEYAWALFESDGDISGLAATLWAESLRLWWLGLPEEAEAQTRRVWHILGVTRDGVGLVAAAQALAGALQAIGETRTARMHLEMARKACASIPFAPGADAIGALIAEMDAAIAVPASAPAQSVSPDASMPMPPPAS